MQESDFWEERSKLVLVGLRSPTLDQKTIWLVVLFVFAYLQIVSPRKIRGCYRRKKNESQVGRNNSVLASQHTVHPYACDLKNVPTNILKLL